MFIIFGQWSYKYHQYIGTACFCLLAGKTTDTYCDFKPLSAIFKKSSIALVTLFGQTLKYYIDSHSTYHKLRVGKGIRHNGLSVDYKTKYSEISKWLINCYGLVILEPENVSESFTLTII